jgi:hypothetical protein
MDSTPSEVYLWIYIVISGFLAFSSGANGSDCLAIAFGSRVYSL